MFYSLTYLSGLRVNGENIKTVFYFRRVENKKTIRIYYFYASKIKI